MGFATARRLVMLMVAILSAACGSAEGLSEEGQLIGTWFRANEGAFVGVEFLPDGKALLTHDFRVAGNPTVTVAYEILEGGRLALIAADGQTSVNQVTIEGDELELRPQAGGSKRGQLQSFRRLDSGVTIAEARKEEKRSLTQREAQTRGLLERLMLQDDVVFAPVEAAERGPRLALHPQTDLVKIAGPPAVLRPLKTGLKDGDRAGMLRIVLELGKVMGPPGAVGSAGGGTFVLEPYDDDDFRPVGTVDGVEVELRRDPDLHAEILAAYAQAEAQMAATFAVVTDVLLARAELRGTYGAPGSTLKDIAFVLVRRGETYAYASPTGYVSATVELRGTVPVLAGRNGRRGAFELRLSTGSQRTRLHGTYSGEPCVVEVIGAVTSEELDRRAQVVERFLEQELRPGLTFRGTVHGPLGRRRAVVDVPAIVQLAVAENGKVTGSASYPTLGGEVALSGSLSRGDLGHRLVVRGRREGGPRYLSPFHPFSQFESQSWQLTIEAGDPPVLSGTWTAGPDGTIELIRPSEADLAAELRMIEQYLVGGDVLLLEEPRGVGAPSITVQLALDPQTMELTGTVSDGSAQELSGPGTVKGRLERGPAFWRTVLAYEPDPGVRGVSFDLELVVVPVAERFTLAGPRILGDRRVGPTQLVSLAADPALERATRALAVQLSAVAKLNGRFEVGDEAFVLVRGNVIGNVFGGGPYDANSHVHAAAVHAGLLAAGELGLVRVSFRPGLDGYEGSERNGVRSGRRRRTALSYTLDRVPVE